MSNFHCINSSCAEVRYKPYQRTDGIRYRYPGEDWVIVDGDDYTIDEIPESCRTSKFREHAFVAYRRTYSDGSRGTGRLQFVPDWGEEFISATFEGNTITVTFSDQVQTTDVVQRWNRPVQIDSLSSYGRWFRETTNDDGEFLEGGWTSNEEAIRLGGQRICSESSCKISIYKDSQLVHFATGSSCPTIESECELSDRQYVIQIEKEPYLQRIEIRDQNIQAYGLGGQLIDASPIPNECLNIYKTFVSAPPFPNNFVPVPSILNPYEYVAQISSDEGCPPPEYEVICNCQGSQCPSDTCSIVCGSTVCCVNGETGDLVTSIPLDEYEGEL